jgi:hypothetical protein
VQGEDWILLISETLFPLAMKHYFKNAGGKDGEWMGQLTQTEQHKLQEELYQLLARKHKR